MATTGGAATWDEGYDLAGITAAGAADALMVMAYDFNWSGSAHAGGVSPIDSPYALDVSTAMPNYLAKVPASKLIWGVPYYGRAWTTTGSTVNGRTCSGTGSCTAASWSIRYDDAVEGAAAKGRQVGRGRPGAVVHVQEPDLRRAGPGATTTTQSRSTSSTS